MSAFASASGLLVNVFVMLTQELLFSELYGWAKAFCFELWTFISFGNLVSVVERLKLLIATDFWNALLLGHLEVHEDTTSTDKLLMGGKHQVYMLNSESTLAHGALGFNSSKGLYICLQAENSEDDYQQLDFVYGVFQPADDLKPDGEHCWISGE